MKKNMILFIIILIVSLVSLILVNNSFLNLNVNKEEIWSIYFDNLKTSVINGNAFVPESPILEATSIKAYDVLISEPGDYAKWTFDVINDGDINAKLNKLKIVPPKCISLEIPANTKDEDLVCDNLEYIITYSENNKEVKESDIIKAHSVENLTLKVEYKGNLNDTLQGDVQIVLFDMDFQYNYLK